MCCLCSGGIFVLDYQMELANHKPAKGLRGTVFLFPMCAIIAINLHEWFKEISLHSFLQNTCFSGKFPQTIAVTLHG